MLYPIELRAHTRTDIFAHRFAMSGTGWRLLIFDAVFLEENSEEAERGDGNHDEAADDADYEHRR